MKNKRVLVIGDIHGGHKALVQCLERSNFDYEKDTLICLGDVVDGWPETPQCIEELLKIKNLKYVMGNHDCVSKDTEFLTSAGWKFFNDISKKDKLAQFDQITHEVNFDFPLKRIHKKSKTLIKIEGMKISQKVTPNHDVFYDGKKIKAKNLLGKVLHEKDFFINTNVKSSCTLDNNWIRLLTWVITDGTIVDYRKYCKKSIKRVIQFKLSKQNKIDKIKKLLDRMKIPYTFNKATMSGINKLQPYLFRIYSDSARKIFQLLNDKKEFPDCFSKMNLEELNICIDTLLDTDAINNSGNIVWCSVNKNNVDIIQQACIQNSIPFVYRLKKNASGFNNGKTQYHCSISRGKKKFFSKKISISEINYDDDVYCFEMPKGTLITRVDGKIAYTGNCWVDNWFKTGERPLIWTEQGGKATIKAYIEHGDLLVKHKNFFDKAFDYVETDDNRLFIHGGCNPKNPLDKQDKDYLHWDRELFEEARWSKTIHKEYKEIYIGHTTTWSFSRHPIKMGNVWMMDQGGGWEGKLSIVDINTHEFWQSDQVNTLYPEHRGRN